MTSRLPLKRPRIRIRQPDGCLRSRMCNRSRFRFSSFNRQSFASLRTNQQFPAPSQHQPFTVYRTARFLLFQTSIDPAARDQFLAPSQRKPFNSLSESSLLLFQTSIDPAARDQSSILSGRRRVPRTAGCLAGLIRSDPSRRFGPRCDGHFQLPPPQLDVPGSLLQPPLQIPRDSLGGYVHPADESIGHAQDKVDIEHAVEEVVKAAGRSHGGCGFLEKLLQLLRFLLLPPRPPVEPIPEGPHQHRQQVLHFPLALQVQGAPQQGLELFLGFGQFRNRYLTRLLNLSS